MANEINITLRVTCVNGLDSRKWEDGTVQLNQSAEGAEDDSISVTTSEADMPFTHVTPGLMPMRNTGSYPVIYGPKSGGVLVPFGTIPVGEVALIRLYTGVTLRWYAVGGTTKVRRMALNA